LLTCGGSFDEGGLFGRKTPLAAYHVRALLSEVAFDLSVDLLKGRDRFAVAFFHEDYVKAQFGLHDVAGLSEGYLEEEFVEFGDKQSLFDALTQSACGSFGAFGEFAGYNGKILARAEARSRIVDESLGFVMGVALEPDHDLAHPDPGRLAKLVFVLLVVSGDIGWADGDFSRGEGSPPRLVKEDAFFEEFAVLFDSEAAVLQLAAEFSSRADTADHPFLFVGDDLLQAPFLRVAQGAQDGRGFDFSVDDSLKGFGA